MKTAELLNEWLTTYERERVKPRTYAILGNSTRV